MAMPLEQESRIWQTIGIIAWAAGAGMLAVLMKENGVVRVTNVSALGSGVAASFMMLAGIAGTVFGRVMQAILNGFDAEEARLWHLFATVCCSCGSLAVLYVALGHWSRDLTLTSLTVALAGAFLIIAGVICLLGNRVMQRASHKGDPVASGGAAKAAGA